jgi:hypothetical protein
MKRSSTLFLKFSLILIAVVAVVALIHFPQSEGRAQGLSLAKIYMDPLIIYGYIASIPFFIALYQLFKLLGFVDKNKVFSEPAVKAVKTIKYCALSIPVLIVLGLIYIRLNAAPGDDPAGPTGLGIVVSFIFIVFATGAGVFQRILQNAVDIKKENDLTV